MAFARTWVEELIAEWMQREGYLVETGMPVTIPKSDRIGKKGGGRYEADVVGARLNQDGLEVLHVETGAFLDQHNAERIGQKFSDGVRQSVTNYFGKRLQVGQRHTNTYHKRFIVTYPHERKQKWDQWLTAIRQVDQEIQVDRLDEFIQREVVRVLPKTGQPTLAEGLWLLCLVHYLWEHGVCGFGSLPAQPAKQPEMAQRVLASRSGPV